MHSILINISRGKCVNTKDLMSYLDKKKFYGVGLDVIDPEPLPKNHKIRKYSDDLIDKALELEGTITGEHGIGQGKSVYLREEMGDAVDIMTNIKSSLDPKNILNPGKIFL